MAGESAVPAATTVAAAIAVGIAFAIATAFYGQRCEPFWQDQPSAPQIVPTSVRSNMCAALTIHAPKELRDACAARDDFGKSVSGGSAQQGSQQQGSAPHDSRGLSLHGVAACVPKCPGAAESCGKLFPECAIRTAAQNSYRCEITHLENKRTYSHLPAPVEPARGVADSPYRVFVVAVPGCLVVRTEPPAPGGGGDSSAASVPLSALAFRDDAASLRVMLTFAEKIRLGYDVLHDVALPDEWTVTLRGSEGWPGSQATYVRLPGYSGAGAAAFGAPNSDPIRVPVMSVFKTSAFADANELRPITLAGLASLLHDASAREPTSDGGGGGEPELLYAEQPSRLTFTAACEPGDSGVGKITIKALRPGARQTGGLVTSHAKAAAAAVAAAEAGESAGPAAAAGPAADSAGPAADSAGPAADSAGPAADSAGPAADSAADSDSGASEGFYSQTDDLVWLCGARGGSSGGSVSPLTGAKIPPGASVWICATVDCWSGEIEDLREVIRGSGQTTISRARKMSGRMVDMSAELPVEVAGVGGAAMGVGNAVSHFLAHSTNRFYL
jgi:hypothetical protein